MRRMTDTLLRLDPILLLAAMVCYGVAAALSVFGVIGGRRTLMVAVRRLGWVGVSVHALSLLARWIGSGHGPYVSKYELLSAYAFVSVLVLLTWSRRNDRARSFAVVVFPVALVLQGVALYTGPEVKMLPPTFTGTWLALHVSFYLLAFGTGVMATAASLLYLLKGGRRSTADASELEELDATAYRQAGLAFAFWGVGLVTGSIWAFYSWGRFWGWDPVETWSLVTWLAFGVYLHTRRFYGWKGTKPALLLLACFVFALISLFGTSILTSTLHSGYFS
jgi:cytochrome c-type biogenesis protein CcsB